MFRAACLASWMAGWATWGSSPPLPSPAPARSPTTNTSGPAGDAQVVADHDPAPAGLLQAEDVGQRVGPHPRPPDQRPGRDHGAVLEHDLVRGGVGHGLAEPDLHAPLAQDVEGVLARARVERRQQVVGRLQQHHPGPGDVQVGEVVDEHVLEQLVDGAGHLHPGGAAADHHHGEGALVDHGRVVLGQLELAQQVGPELQRVRHGLEREAVLLDPRDPEGGRGRPGGQDQVVVGEAPGPPRSGPPWPRSPPPTPWPSAPRCAGSGARSLGPGGRCRPAGPRPVASWYRSGWNRW